MVLCDRIFASAVGDVQGCSVHAAVLHIDNNTNTILLIIILIISTHLILISLFLTLGIFTTEGTKIILIIGPKSRNSHNTA